MDSFIALDDVSVDFPIYNASGRSLKNQLMHAATGGRISTASGRVVVQALRNVSMRVEHGDRVGIVGHNGAGKTTLLRVLAGVYEPTSGRISVSGKVTALFDIGLGMDPDATGYENIVLRGSLLGMSRKEIQKIANEIGTFTELGEYLAMPMRTYSSGMGLRLAFAISTSVRPDILLLDEYFGVGDERFVEKAQKRLDELVESAGILVFASHSKELIRRLCNRIVIMESGNIVAIE